MPTQIFYTFLKEHLIKDVLYNNNSGNAKIIFKYKLGGLINE